MGSDAIRDHDELRRRYECGPVPLSGRDDALYERNLTFGQVVRASEASQRDKFEAIAPDTVDAPFSIAGALDPGDKVVITEDTVTRGESPLEAARVVRELGADPVMILVIVDRGGTCAAMAAREGIAFHALLTAPDLGFDYGT